MNPLPIEPSSLTNDLEFTFEPVHLSDFTLHFRSASYHLHRVTLFNASKFFRVILSPDAESEHKDECHLTDRCREPYGRCISIPHSSIGGKEVTVTELNEFLTQLYDSASVTQLTLWRRRLKAGEPIDIMDDSGDWHPAEVRSIANGETVHVHYSGLNDTFDEWVPLDSHRIQQRCSKVDLSKWRVSIKVGDVIDCLDTANKWLSAEVRAVHNNRVFVHYTGFGARWDAWIPVDSSRLQPESCRNYEHAEQFAVEDRIEFHLSHYFECDEMNQAYELQAADRVKYLYSIAAFDELWTLLRLTDLYHWSQARHTCISALINDPKLTEHSNWKTRYRSISQDTFAELFSAYVVRYRPLNHELQAVI